MERGGGASSEGHSAEHGGVADDEAGGSAPVASANISPGQTEIALLGQPGTVTLRSTSTNRWLESHPPAVLTEPSARATSLCICLYGVAGLSHGRASRGRTDVRGAAVQEAAASHLRHVIEPARQSGALVDVVAHSWMLSPNQNVSHALWTAYDDAGGAAGGGGTGRLVSLRYEALDTRERLLSVTLSISRSLELAREAAVVRGRSYELYLIMRHDLFLFQPMEVLRLRPSHITTGTGCTLPKSAYRSGCGPLTPWRLELIPDYWLVGGPPLLEHFFGSLHYRLSTLGPQSVLRGAHAVAHYLFQRHADDLRLPQRSLLRSHPLAVETVHYTLYRWKDLELDVSGIGASVNLAACDRHKLCFRNPNVTLRIGSIISSKDPGPFE